MAHNFYLDDNDEKSVKLRPKKWKELIEECKENYTEIESDTKEYKTLFNDSETKIAVEIEKKEITTKIVDGKEVSKEKIIISFANWINNSKNIFHFILIIVIL